MENLIGSTLGQYEIKEKIGEGGMAWVFEVLDPRFEGREVVRALKMLKPAAAAGEEFQRFRVFHTDTGIHQ